MRIGLLSLFCLFSFQILAQQGLPIGHSPAELDQINHPDFQYLPTVPGGAELPLSPMRSMAEWEEMGALVVTWTSFKGLLAEIIDAAQTECEVIVICDNETTAINQLTNTYGVSLSNNVTFIEDDYNSIWMRDYGGNPVYANDVDSMHIVDWIYNRNRPKDDALPAAVANYVGVPNLATTGVNNFIVNTGGNFMSDGMGTGFASSLVIEENGPGSPWIPSGATFITEQEVRNRMDLYMGIDPYIIMEKLPFDGIHHIDMHMKLLDEETLMIGEFPQGVSDGPQIEANIQYILDNYTTPFGNPYRIIRMPMPPCSNGQWPWFCQGAEYRTYTNAMFINNTVLVPIYGINMDTEALDIWEAALPGFNIVGLDCSDIIFSGGAIHCITKEVGVKEPLLINHARLADTICSDDPTDIEAIVQHISGISGVTLYYTDNLDNGYQSLSMTSGTDNTWFATIPSLGLNKDMYYYIEGVANDGKTINRPIPAPTGHFKYFVKDCTILNTAEIAQQTTVLNSIYPNPASSLTVIPVDAAQAVDGLIQLKDVYGRTVETIFEGNLPAGPSNHYFYADDFKPGIYFVQLVVADKEYVQKVVIR